MDLQCMRHFRHSDGTEFYFGSVVMSNIHLDRIIIETKVEPKLQQVSIGIGFFEANISIGTFDVIYERLSCAFSIIFR